MDTNDIKRVTDWLGSPVDKTRLYARYPDFMNSTLVHLAVHTADSDLLSILLQYGADVHALNAKGWNPFMVASADRFEQAKILLEWGVEITLPRSFPQYQKDSEVLIDRELFIITMKTTGDNELANLISSEFGGRRCEVINLPNHPQLNGKTCVVEKYIMKKEKYKIIFQGSGNAALVGPNNLTSVGIEHHWIVDIISHSRMVKCLVVSLPQKKSVKHMLPHWMEM